MSLTLCFPSEKEIITYLELHPLTNKKNPLFSDGKIIHIVAEFFANHVKDYKMMSDIQVIVNLHDMNEKLKLSETHLVLIQDYLAKALNDCVVKKAKL